MNGPLINGHRFSYSSLEFLITAGATSTNVYVDIDDVSYEESLEIEFRRGASRAPLGWTAGTYEPGEGSLQMGKSTFQQMIQTIGPGWLGINSLITVCYADIGETLVTDSLVCRISGAADAHSYGPGALVTVVKLKLFSITRNGVPALLNRVF